jgi:hypothetical protein
VRRRSPARSPSSLASSCYTSLRHLSGRAGRRRAGGGPSMAPVDEHALLSSRLVGPLERYDNHDTDNHDSLTAGQLTNLQNSNFYPHSLTTATREPITANNNYTGSSQSHLATRAGSERPPADMFCPLLQHATVRARSTGPVLQRKNAAAFEANYESLDNDKRWAPLAISDPLPPPRSNAALRRLDMAVQGMEQMSLATADVLAKKPVLKDGNGRPLFVDDEEKGEERARVQYDSITVLPASLSGMLGKRELPPPPLPRTRSFRLAVAGGGVKNGGDVRASSAPPVSPLVCRKAGQSHR